MVPDGSAILVRNYRTGLYFRREPGETVAQALARPGCELPMFDDLQGEALGFLPDGSGYVTTSEGNGAPLQLTRFLPAARTGAPAAAHSAARTSTTTIP